MKLSKYVQFVYTCLQVLLVCTPVYAVSTDMCFDTDTKLMAHFNGTDGSTTFTDSSASARSLVARGNAQIDTAQSKFGGASVLLDDSGDAVTSPDSADWDIGTADFTVDGWMRWAGTPGIDYLFSIGNEDNAEGLHIGTTSSTVLRVRIQSSIFTFTTSLSTNTWYHITVTRNGSSLRAFVDGAQVGSTETNSSSISAGTAGLCIGAQNNSNTDTVCSNGNVHNGWIDELRFVSGTAVWTANFTSPSAEYSSTCDVASNDSGVIGNSGSVQYF